MNVIEIVVNELVSFSLPVSFDGGDDGGDEGGDSGDTGFTQADIDQAVNDAVEQATSGLKTKNAQLLDKITKNKSIMEALGDNDVTELLTLKNTVEKNEVLKMMAEGNHEEALSKHTEKLVVNHNATIKKLQDDSEALVAKYGKATEKLDSLLIDSSIGQEYLAQGGFEKGLTDATRRGRDVFSIGDEFAVEARDSEGNLRQGEEGEFTIKEFVSSLKEEAPHLFPESEGGLGNVSRGSQGNNNPSGTRDDDYIAAAEKGPGALRELRQKRLQKSMPSINQG